MPESLIVLGVLVVIAIFILTATVKVVQEYERGVVFRLGRLVGARGPGLILLIPGIERMVQGRSAGHHDGRARRRRSSPATTSPSR